jgi:hypothetical protein
MREFPYLLFPQDNVGRFNVHATFTMASKKTDYLPTHSNCRSRVHRSLDAHVRVARSSGNLDAEIDRWVNEGGALSPCDSNRRLFLRSNRPSLPWNEIDGIS